MKSLRKRIKETDPLLLVVVRQGLFLVHACKLSGRSEYGDVG
jgi:hypothetical protein